MSWIDLHDIAGNKVYLNLKHVVLMSTVATGTAIRTTILDDKGKPLSIVVKEAADAIYGAARAAKSN